MKSYTFKNFHNIKKRALSMVLAGSMMLSAMPAQIFAAGARSATEPAPDIVWSEEIHAHANCVTVEDTAVANLNDLEKALSATGEADIVVSSSFEITRALTVNGTKHL